MSVLVEPILLLSALAVFVALIYLALAHEAATVTLMLVVFVVTQGVRNDLNVSIGAGSIQFYALDVLAAVFLVVAVIRSLTGGIGSLARGLSFLIVACLLVHLVRGYEAYGLQTSISKSRDAIYFASSLAYAATLTRVSPSRVWRLVAITGAALVFVALYYISTQGFRAVSDGIVVDGTQVDPRPVIAGSTLIMLESTILVALMAWRRHVLRRAMLLATASGVVFMEHRTVWVAAAAAGLFGFVKWSKQRLAEREQAVFAVTGATFLILPWLAWAFLKSSALTTSVRDETTSNSTLDWRITGWRQLIHDHHSIGQILFGEPSGASWARFVSTGVTTVSPHNFFLELYLRFGLWGPMALAVIGIILWHSRQTFAAIAGLDPIAVELLLLVQLIFCLTYGLDMVQGLILGLLVKAQADGLRERHQESAAPAVSAGLRLAEVRP